MSSDKNLSSYPKVFNLGHAALADLLLDPVIVEEKVDGSQLSFGLIDGKLRIRSHGQAIQPDAPEKLFANGVAAIKERANNLTPGYTYRGEYLQKPKHNTLAYDRIPRDHIIIFDIDRGLESYLTPTAKQAEANRLAFDCVPLLFMGMLTSYDLFEELLERTSILGGQQIEGVVIKNYARFGRDGHALMGKHVRESYKELHQKTWRSSNPTGGDIVQQLSQELRTEARWEKAIQHLRERGELQGDPRDISPLLREVSSDVREECEELIKQQLFDHAWKKIGRTVVAGLPGWYKDRLAKQQFDDLSSK